MAKPRDARRAFVRNPAADEMTTGNKFQLQVLQRKFARSVMLHQMRIKSRTRLGKAEGLDGTDRDSGVVRRTGRNTEGGACAIWSARNAPILDEFTDSLAKASREVWYKLAGTALGRERRYVRRGIRTYGRSVGSGTALYLLRRNVHRIEKGLTMQPVRNKFATDYIRETVDAFHGALASGTLQPQHPQFNWMYSVLSSYFDVTAASTHRAIVSSRQTFRDTVAAIEPGSPESGPHSPVPLMPTVKIDDLEALAAGRRSVRWFTSEPVSRDLVDRAIQIGAESPTACNRQPYRFEIFDDPISTAKVAAIPMGTDGYEHQIPGLIVIVGNLSAFFDQRDRHLIYIDGCLAAMGLIYGLETQGVNSCCINWPDMPDREAQMRRLLKLKPYERVVMLIAYGYADPDALVPFSAKRLIDEVRTYRSL